MALTFPLAPANGATFTTGGITWTYSSASDSWTGATGGGTITTQFDFQAGAAAPTTTTKADGTTPVTEGDHFWDATNNKLYIYSGAGVWTQIGAGGTSLDPRLQAAALAPTTRADSTALADGDIWYDTTANKLKVRESGAWVLVDTNIDPRIQAAAAAPATRADTTALVDGDLWYDTTANELKVRDTGAWVLVDTAFQFDWQAGAGIPVKTTRSDNTTALVEGDMYWDTTNNNLYARDTVGGTWNLIGSKWATETGGISRSDRIKVGATGAPASAIDMVGTLSHAAEVTTGAMNLLLSDRFACTVTANITFSFTNPPATRAAEVVLRVTNGGGFTVGWPAGVTWIAGSQPTLKSAGTDIILFWTHDGGTSWFAEAVGQSVEEQFIPSSVDVNTATFVDIPIKNGFEMLPWYQMSTATRNASNIFLSIVNSAGTSIVTNSTIAPQPSWDPSSTMTRPYFVCMTNLDNSGIRFKIYDDGGTGTAVSSVRTGSVLFANASSQFIRINVPAGGLKNIAVKR